MTSSLSIGIIGSGFSGICAAIQVQKQFGVKATIFESSDDVGGTWYHNVYPGCGSDVDSHVYSLSFELNPNWSHRYSPQGEILEYVRGVAKKYNLYDQTIFNTEVVQADWLEDQKKWKLTVREKGFLETRAIFFDVVFAGLGPLRVPNYPEEFKSFKGTIVHTAFWDDSIDFTGKRVAVVGSGASAVQVIPKIQPVVSQMTCYQRTPSWCFIRYQHRYPAIVQFLFRYVPFLMRYYRLCIFFWLEFTYLNFRYYDSLGGRLVRKYAAWEMKRRLLKKNRPDLVKLLTPDYDVGCRRITPSETYLEALAEDNVTVERCGISSVDGHTLTSNDGKQFECDILVLATGFNTTGFLGNLQVNGRDKQNLNELWSTNYASTYKSVAIHGFPNFFMLLGPASLLGHNSVVAMAEIQVDNAIQCIKQLKNGVKAIEPTEKAQNKFVSQLKGKLQNTVWSSGCHSWYKDSNGEIFALWSGTVTSFYWKLWRNNFNKDFIKYT